MMEYSAVYTSNIPTFPTPVQETNIELDFVDELLSDGCWVEVTDSSIRPLTDQSSYLQDNSHLITNPHHQIYQDHEDPDHHHQNQGSFSFHEIQSESVVIEGSDQITSRKWWIAPRSYPSHSSSVKERLMLAIGYLRECTKDRDVLIQIWVPARSKGSQQDVTTNYRKIIPGDNYHLGGGDEENWQEIGGVGYGYGYGLPCRGMMGKNMQDQWGFDVRFIRKDEYMRFSYGQQVDVRGCLALPVFERGSGICLGVVEILMTTQRQLNYRPELDYINEALESVDLRSFHNFSPPTIKGFDELYQAALGEIVEVLTSVCKTHRLPLALTWAPCSQQGKTGCYKHSDGNFAPCVSTVESACYVAEVDTLGFHEACLEQHLFKGQGIVGTSFTTNKPCFAVDITAFSKNEYPFCHHARIFGLRAAIAIPVRSTYTGSADFVLEFFLPKDCEDNEEQKRMLNSLSIVIQQSCRSLHIATDNKEVDGEENIVPQVSAASEASFPKESSWIAHMIEAQQKGKGISVSMEYQIEEPREEFKVTTHWDNIHGGLQNGQVFSEFGQLQQSSGAKGSVEGGADSYSFGSHQSSGGRKAGEKRRTKAEKTISLPVLRQYFAGSLKDAAKSIGVCPTTLKRICRQHGISRWPSRKIKKVGHSLRKLQLVIDSVQGAEGAIQIGSFYKSFPELSSPTFAGTSPFTSLNMTDHQAQFNHHQAESGLFSHGAPSKSPTSSCSHNSGPGAKQYSTINTLAGGDVLVTGRIGMLNRACSEAELYGLHQEEPKILRSQSPPSFGEHPDYLTPMHSAFKVKATLGEEKIRFSLQQNWGFRDLQLEIARRLNLDDVSRIDIKYVDDDHEWVLMTCDADLEECKEIYRSSHSHTIRLTLHWASHQTLVSSFGSSSPS
uniref:Nodule inception protein 1 n=1 Tax=Datisca glomerata TaxID=34297 RepID=T1SBU4_DATGL|nr:nodule inception protein 1 [Datisca glomerata]